MLVSLTWNVANKMNVGSDSGPDQTQTTRKMSLSADLRIEACLIVFRSGYTRVHSLFMGETDHSLYRRVGIDSSFHHVIQVLVSMCSIHHVSNITSCITPPMQCPAVHCRLHRPVFTRSDTERRAVTLPPSRLLQSVDHASPAKIVDICVISV